MSLHTEEILSIFAAIVKILRKQLGFIRYTNHDLTNIL